MQAELASVAESVADRLHASEESRNLLIEQTREFKKNSSEVNQFIQNKYQVAQLWQRPRELDRRFYGGGSP